MKSVILFCASAVLVTFTFQSPASALIDHPNSGTYQQGLMAFNQNFDKLDAKKGNIEESVKSKSDASLTKVKEVAKKKNTLAIPDKSAPLPSTEKLSDSKSNVMDKKKDMTKDLDKPDVKKGLKFP